MSSSAERVVLRPPRHAILAERQSGIGRLGHKPVSDAEANRRMMALVDQIANTNAPLDPEKAEILDKVLGKAWRQMQGQVDGQ